MKSDRLSFRRLSLTDLPHMIELESDPDIMKYTPARIPHTREAIAQRLKARIEKEKADAPLGVWALELKDSGDFAGWICIVHTDHKFPELGFMLPKRHWGKGFATEAATRLVRHAFDDLHLNALVAKTDQDNFNSKNVLGKVGFRPAGTSTINDKVLQREVVLDVFERFR